MFRVSTKTQDSCSKRCMRNGLITAQKRQVDQTMIVQAVELGWSLIYRLVNGVGVNREGVP